MPPRASGQVVGREAELAALDDFLGRGEDVRALVVTGVAGIGKTTLWEAGLEAAGERGLRVLSTRATSAETRLSYAALIDLLGEVGADELARLPAPQRTALEVALLRVEPAATPTDSAIALGFLNTLRALAAREVLVVAIDDVPWLDPPSADVVTFAARRLQGEAVLFLLARRPGPVPPLEKAFGPGQLAELEVGPLSYGAIRQMLSERLGLTLPRHLLRRLVDSTLGNPLFALEVGRGLTERGPPPGTGDDLPLPHAVEDLLGTRVAQLPAPTRKLLLAAALSADLTVPQLAEIAGERAVDDAVAGGVLFVDGDRVRASHPLLAAAARRRARPSARRSVHRELAGVVSDEERRARHLALAAGEPDDELAATVAGASASAAARGLAREAIELAEHAMRLTPADSSSRSERLLTLADYLDLAGEAQRVTDVLTPELDSLPAGAPRVRAQLLLSEGGDVRSIDDHQRHLELALVEAREDPVLRARVLAKKSIHATAACVERVEEAEVWALEALDALGDAEPEVQRLALHGLAWAKALGGHPVDDLQERFDAVSGATFHLIDSVDRVTALRHTWRGETSTARRGLVQLLALADERGELWSYAVLRLHLCELELRAGEHETALRLLDEWGQSSEGELLVAPSYERCRALLAAGRGEPDEVETWAVPALAGAEATGARWQSLGTLRARGTAALLAHDPERARDSLLPVWEHMQREGVEDPGAFPVAPDLVEALVELGELDGARAVAARLRQQAETQEHPWGLVTTKRCAGLISLAGRPYDEDAVADLAAAADGYVAMGMRFDATRTLLGLGRSQRRHRKWAADRSSLESAVAAFDEMGSPGWVEEARSELERVGARRPQPAGELSPAEQRVAELAADGLSNKEIAQTLHVTVKTVEAHLSHAYAKLGVRSRSQLASRL